MLGLFPKQYFDFTNYTAKDCYNPDALNTPTLGESRCGGLSLPLLDGKGNKLDESIHQQVDPWAKYSRNRKGIEVKCCRIWWIVSAASW